MQAKSDFSHPASSFYILFHTSFPFFTALSSCIAGYSPYASFPSKTLATNLVSDLSSSSPLDLGNWFILLSSLASSVFPAIHYWLQCAGWLGTVAQSKPQDAVKAQLWKWERLSLSLADDLCTLYYLPIFSFLDALCIIEHSILSILSLWRWSDLYFPYLWIEGVVWLLCVCNTFTFMHLANAFILSDLQCIQAIHFFISM